MITTTTTKTAATTTTRIKRVKYIAGNYWEKVKIISSR